MSAPFITLYVPRKEWFQNLISQLMQREESLSSQLIVLILEDMIKRKSLTKDEFSAAQAHMSEHRKNKSAKDKKSSKPIKKSLTTFNLYIPTNLRWIPERIDQIGKSDGHSKRFKGTYIWNLVLDQYRGLVPKSVKEAL